MTWWMDTQIVQNWTLFKNTNILGVYGGLEFSKAFLLTYLLALFTTMCMYKLYVGYTTKFQTLKLKHIYFDFWLKLDSRHTKAYAKQSISAVRTKTDTTLLHPGPAPQT